jgi:aspartate kinase
MGLQNVIKPLLFAAMARLVLKFGGTSVGDIARIRKVARLVQSQIESGNEIAVVVSAMAGETNKLVALAREAQKVPDLREYDVVISTGEQVTIGLMALALRDIGVSSQSFLGWQIPLRTDAQQGNAWIEQVEGEKLSALMKQGIVPVIAGFQGIGPDGSVTTLGRGGSDTTAVAVAAAVAADQCDIYTDVEGVFTTDPRIVESARKLEKISYEEMLELASQGAKVLQTRSVEIAMRHRVRVQVLSSFKNEIGTFVVDEEEIMDAKSVSGLAYSKEDAKIQVVGIPHNAGVASAIFAPLASSGVNVDMIVQNIGEAGKANITFTVPKVDMDRAIKILRDNQSTIGFSDVSGDANVVKVSVVGLGMRSHVGVAQTMFETLAGKAINIQVISTSEIKISVLIASEYLELALRALHAAYGLDQPPVATKSAAA